MLAVGFALALLLQSWSHLFPGSHGHSDSHSSQFSAHLHDEHTEIGHVTGHEHHDDENQDDPSGHEGENNHHHIVPPTSVFSFLHYRGRSERLTFQTVPIIPRAPSPPYIPPKVS